jgi:hypothetical protein
MKITIEIALGARDTPLNLAHYVEDTLKQIMHIYEVQKPDRPEGFTERKERLIRVIRIEE